MKSLLIKDLSAVESLDRQALRAVRGGIAVGGCIPSPYGVPPAPGVPELPTVPQLPSAADLWKTIWPPKNIQPATGGPL